MAFSVSEDQYIKLLERITTLEIRFNQTMTAMQNVVSANQVNQMTAAFDMELAAINETVTALEQRVTSMELEPLD